MDPLIALLLGVFIGSLISGVLVWLTTRPDRLYSNSEPLRILRGMVGKGILPSHVWEQVSRQMRLQTQPDQKESFPAPSQTIGYQIPEDDSPAEPSQWGLGTRMVLSLWCVSGLAVIARINAASWVLALIAAMIGGAVWTLVRNPAWLQRPAIRFTWFWGGIAGWTLSALACQGGEVDPQKLILAGMAGLASGLGAMVSLNASLRRIAPSMASLLGQSILLFGPIFLLPADFGKWDAESRDWAQVLPFNWLPFAGAAWALSLAARSGFNRTGLVTGLSFFGCWLAGWAAILLSASGQGRGLPGFVLGAFSATTVIAILTRLVTRQEARMLGKIPTGPLSFMVTLFLGGCATTIWMARSGYSPALEAALFLAGSVSAWIALALLGRNLWGVASQGCLLGSIACLSVYMHNSVPVSAWWPFLAKFIGLGLSIGTMGWCLAQWRFPSRKSLPFVCATSLAGVIGWLLPTQALVMATLVEPTWMSEVIRAPLAGWWNLPLAVFSVGVAWWMHRSLPGMRAEIWLTQFILVFAGLATAWATLGLDTEESPQGVLAVLASWSLGGLALGMFRSRWSAFFAPVFLGFAWFLAWSQSGRMPAASPLWSMVPACAAWLMGSFHSLIHGKRWVLLGSVGSIMVGLSAWSAFESVHFGPGLLVGALLIALNLMALEMRHQRDWLAPQSYRKALRLREPSLWLGVCQILLLAGSFLTVRDSGHGGWLALALIAQSVVLWMVRGDQSAQLAQLQGLGAAMAGGLFAMGVGESLDSQVVFPGLLATVPSLGFFVPGALAGIGIRQMVTRHDKSPKDRGPQMALGILAAPSLFTLFQSVSPSPDWSQWIMAFISASLWPALAWITGPRAGHSSRGWYQAALIATVIPLAMAGISLFGIEGIGIQKVAIATLLASGLTAGWCLIAPHVDIAWSLQSRQAFATTGRHLLALGLVPMCVLAGLAQISTGTGFSDSQWLTVPGICLAALVSAVLANEQRSLRKAMRLQAFCLGFLMLGLVWMCGSLQFSASVSRNSAFFFGSLLLLVGASSRGRTSAWQPSLQSGGTIAQLAVLGCLGLSLVTETSLPGFLAGWGIDTFATDWRSWLLEISILSLLFGFTGRFASGENLHPSIRLAFLAWAATGWVGIAIGSQGANAPGCLLAATGLICGASWVIRQPAVKPHQSGELPNREAA